MTENEISRIIVQGAIEVHKTLGGPGLIESVYEEALAWELTRSGLVIKRQVEVPIMYKGTQLSAPLRLDMLANDLVIVECKATPKSSNLYAAQALTYLRLRDLRLAMVINFGERLVKNGIQRVINGTLD
jgi:GxxExxY protein